MIPTFAPPSVRQDGPRWLWACPRCRCRDTNYLTYQRAQAAYHAHCQRAGCEEEA